MRLTRPGADQTPAGSAPKAAEKACATADPEDAVDAEDSDDSEEVEDAMELAAPSKVDNSAQIAQPRSHALR
jgi:hypothetical protein